MKKTPSLPGLPDGADGLTVEQLIAAGIQVEDGPDKPPDELISPFNGLTLDDQNDAWTPLKEADDLLAEKYEQWLADGKPKLDPEPPEVEEALDDAHDEHLRACRARFDSHDADAERHEQRARQHISRARRLGATPTSPPRPRPRSRAPRKSAAPVRARRSTTTAAPSVAAVGTPVAVAASPPGEPAAPGDGDADDEDLAPLAQSVRAGTIRTRPRSRRPVRGIPKASFEEKIATDTRATWLLALADHFGNALDHDDFEPPEDWVFEHWLKRQDHQRVFMFAGGGQ